MIGSLSFFVGVGSMFGLTSDVAWMIAAVLALGAAAIWLVARIRKALR